MTTVDLTKFEKQISILENANRALELQAQSLSPSQNDAKPVHVLYGGAHLFSDQVFTKIFKLARDCFHFAVPNAQVLQKLVGDSWTKQFSDDVYARITQKMNGQLLEDYRVDFEDGYGVRAEDEEDAHAVQAAEVVSKLESTNAIPCSIGIRVKPLSTASMRRSLRTLVLFVEKYAEQIANQSIKPRHLKHLIVTLPKVTNAEQVSTLVEVLEDYERNHPEIFKSGFFKIELLIESPEAFLTTDGTLPLARFLAAANGRCHSIHFGIYDFTSSLGIGSAGQSIDHLACDFARMWMQILAGIAPGLGVSDGIINKLPLMPKENSATARTQFEELWTYNFQQMQRSLSNGYYQGWDLHPCQLHIRHLSNIVFVMKEFDGAVARLKAFVAKSAQASHVKGLFDDRASVLGLLNFFERSLESGVVTESDLSAHGINLQEIRTSI